MYSCKAFSFSPKIIKHDQSTFESMTEARPTTIDLGRPRVARLQHAVLNQEFESLGHLRDCQPWSHLAVWVSRQRKEHNIFKLQELFGGDFTED